MARIVSVSCVLCVTFGRQELKTNSLLRQCPPIKLFGWLCLDVRTPLVLSKSDINLWAINFNSTALEYQFSKAWRNEQEHSRNRFEKFLTLWGTKCKIRLFSFALRYRWFRPLVLGWGQVWSTGGMITNRGDRNTQRKSYLSATF